MVYCYNTNLIILFHQLSSLSQPKQFNNEGNLLAEWLNAGGWWKEELVGYGR